MSGPTVPGDDVLVHALPDRAAMSFEDARPAATDTLPPGADRRAKLRIDVLGQIDAHSVWRLRPLSLRELSETGFSLESTGPFESDVVHKFRISAEAVGRSVVVQAAARHCTLASMAGALPIYVTGFELMSPSDNTRREILSLMRFADSMWRE
jgi:hypothetical protein